ncbi:hypothetical protein KP509_37G013200 [Ceratopteris richardii]|uniref:Uncharacterized protein n=1 Tax=Ceratopteris richardii TaxID=49495 RepID=A0A8T2Q5Q4_CERRI|nr:hypothetical protein KP509_37G013200 [Ceratopteris richardii]
MIARFGKPETMPKDFFDDFVKVAEDEARHFRLLASQLVELGSSYGAFPAHDGLWESAEATADDIAARLAIEHCVHEARGLDVLPTTIVRFQKGGDKATADLLHSVVYPEEISHCAAGIRWFTYVLLRRQVHSPHIEYKTLYEHYEDEEVVQAFHAVVRTYFKGPLKPPFNIEARNAAGFPLRWYLPLSTKDD